MMREEALFSNCRADGVIRTPSWASSQGIERLWLLLPVLLLIYKGFIFPLPPLDFWWHLKMGEVIGTTGSIPRTDLFSFTAQGQPFVLQNWLGELFYYWTFTLGGFPLLVLLGTVLTVAGFLLMYQLCLQVSANVRIAAFVGFLAALGNYGFLRPQTYSFLLFTVFYWVLVQFRERGRDYLWLLPPVMALWVNLHGAFVLGLGLIALFALCEGFRRAMGPQRTDALTVAQIRKLGLILAACALATLINPEGWRLYDYVRTVVFDAGSQTLVAEWRPPRVNDFLGFLLFYCPFFLTVFAFIRSRVRPDLTELSLFFGFSVFGLMSIRNAAWFSTVTYPLLARYLSVIDLDGVQSLLNKQNETTPQEPRFYSRLNMAVLSAALIVLVTQSPWIRPAVSGTSLIAEQTPVGAADFMEREKLTGRLFHPQEFGDYLLWRLWPLEKTFVDGRVHLFSLDFLKDYERGIEDPIASGILDRWQIQYVLLRKFPADVDAGARRAVESAGWIKKYEDKVAVLYERGN
jgi:hypothetical protein